MDDTRGRRKVFRIMPETIIGLLHEGEHHFLIEKGFPALVQKPLCTQFEIDKGTIGILVEDESFAPVPPKKCYPRLDFKARDLQIYNSNPVFEPVSVSTAPIGDIVIRQGDERITISILDIDRVVAAIKAVLEEK
jgi:hypothetical protein